MAPAKKTAIKAKSKTSSKKSVVKPPKETKEKVITPSSSIAAEWLQDASIEVPTVPGQGFKPGQREFDFSVGLRQQPEGDLQRLELRGRAVVHSQGAVLAMVEASYVVQTAAAELATEMPQYMYAQLRPQLEKLLNLAGQNPPLPEKLEKVAA